MLEAPIEGSIGLFVLGIAPHLFATTSMGIMLAAPTTHFVSLAQAILYRGAGFSIVWPQFLALIAIGNVFFVLALTRFRKTIGSMA